jgi:hypothetical protein
MAIRFYCPYCNRLLGISQRRAGAVVECPSCHGKVGVPIEEPVARAERPVPLVLLPPEHSPDPPHTGIVLTRTQLLALLLAVGLMLCVSFAIGLLIGAL